MPLSVPVDIPPSNKLDPLMVEPKGVDSPLPSITSTTTRVEGAPWRFRGFAYNAGRDLVYVQDTTVIEVYEGFSGTLKRQFTFEVDVKGEQGSNNIAFIDGELFGFPSGTTDKIDVYEASSGNFLRTLDLSGITSDLESMSEWGDNLLITDNNKVYKIDPADGSVLDSIDKSDLSGNNNGPIVVNGNLITINVNSSTFDHELYVYDGFSSTFVDSVNIQSLLDDFNIASNNFLTSVATGFDGTERVRLYIDDADDTFSDVNVVDLNFETSVTVFQGSIDADLVKDDVYYFYFPYGTTKASFSIELNGVEYPVNTRNNFGTPGNSVQGIVPMFFTGSSFSVITLTETLAASVYGFSKEAGNYIDPGLAFDTRRIPDENRDTEVVLRLVPETDGTNNGRIIVVVDLSGGNAISFSAMDVEAHASLGAGSRAIGTSQFTVPAGASYEIQNTNDPNSGNVISEHREFST